MSPGHFADAVFQSDMELRMAVSTMALSFLVDPAALFLILKPNNISEYIQFNIM